MPININKIPITPSNKKTNHYFDLTTYVFQRKCQPVLI